MQLELAISSSDSIGPKSPGTNPIPPGAQLGSHYSTNVYVTGHDWTRGRGVRSPCLQFSWQMHFHEATKAECGEAAIEGHRCKLPTLKTPLIIDHLHHRGHSVDRHPYITQVDGWGANSLSHTHTHMHARMHTHTHTHTSLSPSLSHTHARTHAHTHTHTHTHNTHTYAKRRR